MERREYGGAENGKTWQSIDWIILEKTHLSCATARLSVRDFVFSSRRELHANLREYFRTHVNNDDNVVKARGESKREGRAA